MKVFWKKIENALYLETLVTHLNHESVNMSGNKPMTSEASTDVKIDYYFPVSLKTHRIFLKVCMCVMFYFHIFDLLSNFLELNNFILMKTLQTAKKYS